jgi:hypothetical protein
MTYVRVQARYYGRLGVEVGIFVAVDHLRRAGVLSPAEESQYLDIDDWFNDNLPNPPFYDDGNSMGAVTWFKTPIPTDMAERVAILRNILHAHGVEHDVAIVDEPGETIYEDAFQVGVIPRVRREPTPMPAGLVLGPTSPGSKREFARGQ